MLAGLRLVGEEASAFHDHIDAELAPGQVGGVAFGTDMDPTLADIHGAFLGLHSAVEGAMNAVKAEQMGVGFHRAKIIDRHDLDVLAAAFHDAAQNQTTNAPEAVNRNLHCHVFVSSLSE